jgi:hypothetical protein
MLATPLWGRPSLVQLGSDEFAVQPNRQHVLAGALLSGFIAGGYAEAAKIRTVAARARDDVVAARVGLRRNPVYLFAVTGVACQPLIGFGGNLEGPYGSRVVCADGDGHSPGRFLSVDLV